ncbi:uncharacterized protein LOC127752257, partial [Frankliniella occidentalis]|uniref:Uncharacterized protein LOC127752257 n=1 Tax=Frankliniella occidentalis TaxID=133901 RepID=A0A9C6XBG0_FRAOC
MMNLRSHTARNKSMERLPNEVLLEVMMYLSVEDLFACRLVSKRLAALAMHPYLWRREWRYVSSHVYNRSRCYACPALRLAPCLTDVSVEVPSARNTPLYKETRCAVSSLSVGLKEGAAGAALEAALVIRNQEALGRMTSLHLFMDSDVDASQAAVLLETVALVSGLKKLTVFNSFPLSEPPINGVYGLWPRSSLTHFSSELSPESEVFCNFVLAAHAATLEDVSLYEGTSTSTAALLAGMPKLRELECCALPGMEAVAACESLRELTLHITSDTERLELRAAAAFLGGATQLLGVVLEYDEGAGSAPATLDMDLILALAATGRSRVETLDIYTDPQDDDDDNFCPHARSLLQALPHLPALRALSVGCVPDALLLGITPRTAQA